MIIENAAKAISAPATERINTSRRCTKRHTMGRDIKVLQISQKRAATTVTARITSKPDCPFSTITCLKGRSIAEKYAIVIGLHAAVA